MPSTCIALAFALACCACAGTASLDGAPGPPLWSVRDGRFVDERTLVEALRTARFRFIGEVHDNGAQHALRARLVASLADQRPAAVMEIFDVGNEAALAQAQARGADADAIATAGDLDRAGWRWPLHRPLVEAALAARLPIRAANVARGELMTLARSGDAGRWQARVAATSWGEREQQAVREAIVDSHCGALPEQAVPVIALAQRIRDAAMADALAAGARDAGGAVLLAGNGHVRRDVGAPRYLAPAELPRGDADIVAVAFAEASGDEARSSEFAQRYAAQHPGYDYVWFTPPAPRPDPCEVLKRGIRRAS